MKAEQEPLEVLYAKLKTSEAGLTNDEAERRLAEFGPNEPAHERRISGFFQFIRFFANPLVIILLIASAVSAAVGELVNASIIVSMVLLSVALNVLQTYRSHRAVERLRAGIVLTATASWNRSWVEIPRSDLVPGDVIRLSAGGLVPADARLIQAKDLHVQEAALTGESLPVEKEAGDRAQSAEEINNLIYLGTSVVSGTATALVIATGASIAFGDIAARLAARPPETEFERGTRQFGFLIMKTVVFLVLFVFLVNAALRHNTFESLLFALALAVGLTPEFLPMIMTVTLGQGALRMAREKVIVKNLSTIQNFGSMDILCSDKTGTLTTGEMVLDQHVDPFGSPLERVFYLAYLNSFYETGIKNPLDAAILKKKANINPLDAAILQHDHPDIHEYEKLDEIPFDFERRRLSIVVGKDGERLLISKGAPEGVLPICSTYVFDGRQSVLDGNAESKCKATYQAFNAKGYRVLAVAYRPMRVLDVYRKEDEKELVLVGFLAFFDPPVAQAPELLQALRRDGVEVKILTGDNELVARHICPAVGLDVSRILLGNQLDQITDSALAHVVEKTTVFARVSPAQKNRIIHALKRRAHVVGFLGDGINDAPSLHAADVGISVPTAVDVARDAADIILCRTWAFCTEVLSRDERRSAT